MFILPGGSGAVSRVAALVGRTAAQIALSVYDKLLYWHSLGAADYISGDYHKNIRSNSDTTERLGNRLTRSAASVRTSSGGQLYQSDGIQYSRSEVTALRGVGNISVRVWGKMLNSGVIVLHGRNPDPSGVTGDATRNIGFQFNINGTSYPKVTWQYGTNSFEPDIVAATPLSADGTTVYFLGFDRDVNAGTVRHSRNGVQESAQSYLNAPTGGTAADTYPFVGGQPNSSFQGITQVRALQDVMFFDSSIAADEDEFLYNSGSGKSLEEVVLEFDPGAITLSLWLRMEGANNTTIFRDTSSKRKVAISSGGAKISNSEVPSGETVAGYFDGSNDYVYVAHDDDFNLGTADWAVRCQLMRRVRSDLSAKGIACHDSIGGTRGWLLLANSDLGTVPYALAFGAWDGGTNYEVTDSVELPLNVWHDVIAFRYGSIMGLCRNGVLLHTVHIGSASIGNPNVQATVGALYGTSTQHPDSYWPGSLKHVKLRKGAAEIAGVPFSTIAFLNAPQVFIGGDSPSAPLVESGPLSLSSSPTGMSYGLAGPGDQTSVALTSNITRSSLSSDSSLGLTGNNWSVGIWINYDNAQSGYADLLGKGYPDTSGWAIKASDGAGFDLRFGNSFVRRTLIHSRFANRWCSMFATYASGTLILYRNGFPVETITGLTNISSTADAFGIGPHASGGSSQTAKYKWARLEIYPTATLTASQIAARYYAGVRNDPDPDYWSPEDITSSTLKIWLDETSPMTLSSSEVSQWNDKTANNYHFSQGTNSKRPIVLPNGLSGMRIVRFDGTDDILLSTSGAQGIFGGVGQGWSYILYKKRTVDSSAIPRTVFNSVNGADASSRFVIQHQASGGTIDRAVLNVRRLDNDSTSALVAGASSSGWTLRMDTMDWSQGDGTIYLNGVQSAQNLALTSSGTTSVTPALHPLGLGAYSAGVGSANFSDIDVAEVIVGNGAIPSLADRQRLDGYLAHKWKMQYLLAADHPYRLRRP